MRRDDLSISAGTAFIVSDALGNIDGVNGHGLYAFDTRHLSYFVLKLESTDIELLQSGTSGPGRSEVYARNIASRSLPENAIEIYRRRELGTELRERIELTNRGNRPYRVPLTLSFDADFADIFEVRSLVKPRQHERSIHRASREIRFHSTDRSGGRLSRVVFTPDADPVSDTQLRYSPELDQGETWAIDIQIRWTAPKPDTSRPVPQSRSFAERDANGWRSSVPILETDDAILRQAYEQAMRDIMALQLPLSSGVSVPAAGIPWYLAIFGRDTILTSHQLLLTGYRQAAATLQTLAAWQSDEDSEFFEAEPGKMPHEIRFGELARTGAIPHGRYYGSVDGTPLWIILLRDYVAWSGDIDVARALLPHAERAMNWIDQYGDLDGDGLIEYQTRSPHGLRNQGWKDSPDSIQFADGRLAAGPIALVEVQGYAYAAKLALAEIYTLIGKRERAFELRRQAITLRNLIEDAFWMPDEGYYALALNGQKQQVTSITSNPGHLLWCGVPSTDRAKALAARLLSPELFSGWGIRTLATTMKGYNPFSYHNGSVWPHDNSLIVAGLGMYGFGDAACQVINAILDATSHFPQSRLPELFCGYERSKTPFPVDYPVACSPQAWASGSIIRMLQTLVGVTPGPTRLDVEPLAHGRQIELHGITFRERRYDVRSQPGIAVAHRSGNTQ